MDSHSILLLTARSWLLAGCLPAALPKDFGATPLAGQVVRPFSDVPSSHWAAKAVEELHRLGILVGYPPSARQPRSSAPPPRQPPKRPARPIKTGQRPTGAARAPGVR